MKLSELMNYRTFGVTFLGHTNTKPERFKIFETARRIDRPNQSKIFSYKSGCVQQQALDILLENGFKIVSLSNDKDNYYFHVDSWGKDFKEIKDIK